MLRVATRGASPTPIADLLPTAAVQIQQVRNGMGKLTFQAAVGDPRMGEVIPYVREVQAWRDGVLVFTGPPMPPSFDGKRWTFQCFDATWYALACKQFGRADFINYIENGGFEDSPDFDHWTAVGTTATIETGIVNDGNQSAKMTGAGYLEQTFTWSHSYGPGLIPTLYLYVYWPTASGLPANGPKGAPMIASLECSDRPGVLRTFEVDDIPRDGWTDYGFHLGRYVPPGTYSVTARIYNGPDVSYADSVQSTQPDSTSAAFPSQEITEVFNTVIAYSQDPGAGKSDEGLTVVQHPTGTEVFIAWNHSRHERISQAIDQLVRRVPGCEWWFDPTTHEIHVAAARGTYRPEHRLERGRQVVDVQLRPPARPATAIVVQSTAIEEGGYIDASLLDGLIIEETIQAPPSASVRDLDPHARFRVERRNKVSYGLTVTVQETATYRAFGVLVPGDTVPFVGAEGGLVLDGDYTIESMTAVPKGRVELELEPVA